MIDERSLDETGGARFSDDRHMRYRLSRLITPRAICPTELQMAAGDPIRRVVWIMCNPSVADAFRLDPTVTRCCEFARRWGADICEVVNLFALRSTDPKVLYEDARAAPGACGDYSHLWRMQVGADPVNDREILDAVAHPNTRVIAAWGTHGELGDRGDYVRTLLRERHVTLEVLRFSKHGHPNHPLARGKHFIPYEAQPQVWAPSC